MVLRNPSQINIEIFEEQKRQGNNILKREKRLYEKEKVEEIERNKYNAGKFFSKSGSIKASFKPQIRKLSDESRNLILEKKQIVNHFKVFYHQLLNQSVEEEDNETIYFHTAEPKIEKFQ